MEDEGGQDWKIVAVAEKDPRQTKIQSIDDIDEQYKNHTSHRVFLGIGEFFQRFCFGDDLSDCTDFSDVRPPHINSHCWTH